MTQDTTLPDECDFCDRVIDPDESLTPVYVGEPPEPKPTIARATAQKQRKVVGRRATPDSDLEVLGRPVGEIVAILDALEESSEIDVSTKQAVKEVQMVGEETPRLFDSGGVDHDRVGATIRVEPSNQSTTPSLEVCEFCAESLNGQTEQ